MPRHVLLALLPSPANEHKNMNDIAKGILSQWSAGVESKKNKKNMFTV